MPDLRLVASLGRQARDSWVAALATAHVVFAWFAPSWVAPLVLLWAGLFAWRADIRSAWTPRALLAAAGLLAFLALKDLALPGPFAAELARLDPASAPTRFRQPD